MMDLEELRQHLRDGTLNGQAPEPRKLTPHEYVPGGPDGCAECGEGIVHYIHTEPEPQIPPTPLQEAIRQGGLPRKERTQRTLPQEKAEAWKALRESVEKGQVAIPNDPADSHLRKGRTREAFFRQGRQIRELEVSTEAPLRVVAQNGIILPADKARRVEAIKRLIAEGKITIAEPVKSDET